MFFEQALTFDVATNIDGGLFSWYAIKAGSYPMERSGSAMWSPLGPSTVHLVVLRTVRSVDSYPRINDVISANCQIFARTLAKRLLVEYGICCNPEVTEQQASASRQLQNIGIMLKAWERALQMLIPIIVAIEIKLDVEVESVISFFPIVGRYYINRFFWNVLPSESEKWSAAPF